MKTIIVLLCCLGLVGCATAPRESKTGHKAPEKEIVGFDQKELDDMISIFSEAIKKRPNYAGAYYNRAVAYYYKGDYDKSWQDVRKAQKLIKGSDPALDQLIKKLRVASGRQK